MMASEPTVTQVAPGRTVKPLPELYGSGIGWLDSIREAAWKAYQEMPLPDRTAHLWRYTDPKEFVLAEPVVPKPDQRGLSVTIDPSSREAGAVAIPLVEAACGSADLVQGRLGSLVPADFGKAEALNAALWESGVFVRVPRGVVLDRPIRITATLEDHHPVGLVRTLIVLEPGASATVIEESRGSANGDPHRFNSVTEIFVGQEAQLRYATLQHLGSAVTAHRTVRARLDREARIQTVIASLGAGLDKADIGTRLEGPGADSRMLGLCFADGRRRADHHTVHDHRCERSTSDISFRVVLSGRARSAYTGLIRIARDAPYCEAFQENRNLLLSENSRAESIPELEILTDEVRCTHGATAGPIDAEQLFYLRSRGLSEAGAIRMVVDGFLEKTLEQLPDDLRTSIREEMVERMKEFGR